VETGLRLIGLEPLNFEGRRIICFDLETYRFAPGRMAPPMVCMSWTDGERSGLVKREEGLRLARMWLEDDTVLLVNQNIAFDMAVIAAANPELFMPPIFAAYARGRIVCTMVYQQLLDIANGQMNDGSTYSLEATVRRRFGESVEGKHGEDVWRLRYRELENVAIADWPEEARRYVINDSILALRCFLSMVEEGDLPNVAEQCRAAWVLQLIRCWGIRTDGESVEALNVRLHDHVDHNLVKLVDAGIYRMGGTKKAPKLTKNEAEVKRRVFAELGQSAGLTEGGERNSKERGGLVIEKDVAIAVEQLEKCKDPALLLLAEISGDQKLLNTYIPLLRKGVSGPLHPYWNTLVNTGRTSCSGPNLQNQPRKPGVRECFTPRPGWVFISCDYHTAELRSLAQVLLEWYGESQMAEVLRAGRDIHLVTAASILGITYDEVRTWYKGPHAPGCGDKTCVAGCLKRKAIDARQLAKAVDFGVPGGLGAATFIEFAAGPDYRITLTLEESQNVKQAFLNAFPEMIRFFADIGKMCNDGGGRFTLVQPGSGRLRGNCSYTAGSNSTFQGRTADGMKDALFHVVREQYDPTFRHSPLYGTRTNAPIHDEVFMESPEEQAAEAGERVSEVMVERMSHCLPDIPVTAEAALMRRWSKAAGDAVRNKQGRLIPWEDRLL
jgi:hypothetical protein